MNENLSDVDRQLNDYLSGKSGRMPNLTGDDRSESLKGAVAGYHQLRGLGYGVTGLLGDVTGWEGAKKWGVEGYQSAMEDASKYQASVPDITRARSAGEVADWMMYYIPNAMVSTMPTIAAGGVPGLVAKAGGKKFVEKAATELVRQGINKAAAKELAQAQLAKRVQHQMMGSTLATGVGMSAGGIYGDTGDAGVALSHGAVAGAIDALPVMSILNRAGLGKVAREGIADSVGKAMGKGALEEAGTEGLQSFIEQHASHWVASNGESLLQNMDAVDWREMINSSLAGAGAGGTFSGMAGIPNAMENRRMNKASDAELAGAVEGFDKRIGQVVKAKNEAIARGHDTKILNEQIDNLKLQRDKVNQMLANRNQGGLNLGEALDITSQTPAADIVPAPVGTQGVSGRQPINLGAPLDITSPYNPSIAGAAQEAMQAEADKGGDALTQAIAGSRAAGAAQESNADRLIQGQSGYQATGLQQPSLTYGDQSLENAKAQVQQQIAELNEQFERGAIDFDQYADMTMDLDSMGRTLEQQSRGAAPPIPDMTQPGGAPMGASRGAYGTGLGTVPQGTTMEDTLRASTGTGAKGVLARRQLAGSEKWTPPTEVVPEEAPIPEPEPQQPTPVTPQAGQPKPQLPQKTVPYSVIDIVSRHKQRMANKGYDVNWQNLQQGKGSELRRLQKQLEQRRKLQALSKAEQDVLDTLNNWQSEQPEVGQIPEPTVTGVATGQLTLPETKPPKKPPEEPPAGGGKPAEPTPTGKPEPEVSKYKNSFNAPIHLIKLAKDNGLDVFNDDSKLFWNSKNDEYWFQYRDTGKRLTDEELTQEIEKSGTEEYQQEVRQAKEEQERQKEENRQRLEKSREARLKRIAKQDEIYQKRAAGEQPWRTRKKAQQQLETWKLQDSHYVELTTYSFDPTRPAQKAYYIKRLPEKPVGLTFEEVTGNNGRTFIVPATLESKDPLTGKVKQLYPTADYESIDKWTGIKSQKVPGTDLKGWIADPESFASRIDGHVIGRTDYRPKAAEAAPEPAKPAKEPVSTVASGDEPIVNNYPDSWKEGEVIGDYRLATDHGYGNTYRNGFDVSQADFKWHSKFNKEEKDFFESIGGTTSTEGSSYFTWDKYDYVREKLRERAGQSASKPAIEPASFSENFVVPGDIGGVPSPGEILNTATGRKATPFPKWDTGTPRKAKNSEKKINEWLMDNAIEEARSRGDDFNLRQFEANRDRPSVADRESANEYLFGEQQPQTVKPITKPLVTPEQAAEPRPGLEKMVAAKEAKEAKEAEPTAREQRKTRRKRNLIAIDDEIREAGKDLTEALRGSLGTFNSGVNPELAAKIMVHGMKVSALYMRKGAIKFADWADNMLAFIEDQGFSPEAFAPYLKQLYLGTAAEVDDATADQMDDSRTVRAFDVNSLIEPEEAVSADQIKKAEDAIIDLVINPVTEEERLKTEKYILSNPDEQNSRIAADRRIDKAVRALVERGDLDQYKAFVEDGNRERVTDAVMAERERRLKAAEPTPKPEPAAEPEPTPEPAGQPLTEPGATGTIGKYTIKPLESGLRLTPDEFLVSGTSFPELNFFNKKGLGGVWDKAHKAFRFPESRRKEIIAALEERTGETVTTTPEPTQEPVLAPVPETAANAGAEPKKLTQAFYEFLSSGKTLANNMALKKFIAEREGIKSNAVTAEQVKKAQEAFEVALVMQARDIIAAGNGDKATYNRLLMQYLSQPNLDTRSSTSIENQAYSTPAPLAYLAGKLAGLDKTKTVYEPTAGNGMLLVNADIGKATVNELDNLRASHLAEQGYQPTQHDAATWIPNQKHDVMITNPPFGVMHHENGGVKSVDVNGYPIKKLEHLIAARAMESMTDDGKASIIIGANKKEGEISSMDRLFFNWLYENYNVVDHFEINGDLYKKQGAGWPVRIITVHGRRYDDSQRSPKTGTIERLNTWDEIYDRYEKTMDSFRAGSDRIGKDSDGSREPAKRPAGMGTEPDRPVVRSGEGSTGGTGRRGGSRPDNVNVAEHTTGGTGRPNTVQSGGKPADVRSGNHDDRQGQLPAGTTAIAGEPKGDNGTVRGNGSGLVTGNTGKPDVSKSDFQTPYQTASGGSNDAVLTPVNMASNINNALLNIVKDVGNIDEYVMGKLGYESRHDLYNAFMGLQIDTIAAAIYNHEKKGKGIIIADQTGVGKGRQAAGIIRYAKRQGMIPVFITVKDNLFTDMYNDLRDIGETDARPLILNQNAVVKQQDEKGNDLPPLFKNPSRKKHVAIMDEIAATGELPEGSNMLFMTYSQINKVNIQRDVVAALKGKAYFVLDESHNAAGQRFSKVKGGGQKVHTAGFVYQQLEGAPVTYLSATYAKRPDNMPLYYRTDIMDAVDSAEDLITAVGAGGVPLQTLASNMLAESGQLFRRERTFEGISVKTEVDYENSKVHRKAYDTIAKGLRAITLADQVFQKYYMVEAKDRAEEFGETVRQSGNQPTKSLDHQNFTSIIHNYIRQTLMALKADKVISDAVALKQQGIKPVIATDSTMGSFIADAVEKLNLAVGDEYTLDYRDILSRALERTRRVSIKDKKDNSHPIQIEMDELDPITRQAFEDAQVVIDSLDISALPISPIDYVRQGLIDAGLSVAEITGRDYIVDYSGNTPVLAMRDKAEIKDRRGTVDKFNNGELDALILNQAGSTGLSIHASERFNDTSPRHMIVWQASQDINTLMQMLGRINRTGQVEKPAFSFLNVDLPAEKRPTAIISGKMKSLNANTSANSESDTSLNTPDMLNRYGNKIVNDYLLENRSLARQLEIEVATKGEPDADLARKFTGRMALLETRQQEDIYREIESAYNEYIEYLDKTDQNDLNPKTIDLDARILSSSILYQGKKPGTVFGGDTILHEVDVKYQGKPPTPEDVGKALDKALEGTTPDAIAKRLLDAKAKDDYFDRQAKRVTDLQKKWTAEVNKDVASGALDKPGQLQDLVDRLRNNENYGPEHKLTKKYENYLEQVNTLDQSIEDDRSGVATNERLIGSVFKVGNHLRLEVADEDVTGIVTAIKDTHKAGKGNPYSLSKTKVTIMVNNGVRQVELPLSQLLPEKNIFKERLHNTGKTNLDDIFTPFLGTGERREKRFIATGNPLGGFAKLSESKGRVISFTDKDGKVHQGIFMPRSFGEKSASAVTKMGNIAFRDPAVLTRFLQSASDRDRVFSKDHIAGIRKDQQGNWIVEVPRSGGKQIGNDIKFDKPLQDIMGTEFYSRANKMSAIFSEDKLPQVVSRLLEITPFYTFSANRKAYEAAGGPPASEAKQTFETTQTPAPAGVSGSGAGKITPAFFSKHSQGKQTTPAKGMTKDEALLAVSEFMDNLSAPAGRIEYKVYESAEELINARPGYTEEEKAEIRSAYGFITPVFDQSKTPRIWRVVLFANAHNSQRQLRETLQHEVIGHVGLDTLEAADKKQIIEAVSRTRNLKLVKNSDRELFQQTWDYIDKEYHGYSEQVKAEEFITKTAENMSTSKTGILAKLWKMLVKAFRRSGFIREPRSKQDIVDLLHELHNRVQRGESYKFHTILKPEPVSEINDYLDLRPTNYRKNSDGSASFTIKGAADQAGRFFSGQSYAENELVKGAKRSGMSAREFIRKGLLPSLGGRQITDLYAKYVEPLAQKITDEGVQVLGNPLKNYQNHLQNMQALANNKAHEANDIDIEWGKLATVNPVDYESVSDLMHMSTIYEVNPYEDFTPFADMDKLEHKRDLIQDELNAGHDVDDAEDVKRYEDLKAQYQRIANKIEFEQDRDRIGPQLIEQYNQLGDKAKSIYKDVEKYYQDMWQETHDALVSNVERNVKEGNDRKAFLDFLKTMFASNQVRGPYFPLKRHGDYFIIAEDENGERYREHFETLGAMDKGLEDLKNQGFTIFKSGRKTKFNAQDAAGVSEFAGKLYDAMNGPAFAHIPPETRFQMQEEINQAVLQMLPEVSAAKSQIRRRKIKGYSQNARRSFAFTAIHSANRLARITYADQMMSEIKRIEDDIDSHNTEGVIPHKDIPVASAIVDEMKERHETIINPKGSPAAAAVTNAAFIWYLGASAGAGLVNMTQTPLIALPLLGSRFGFRKSGKAFLKATADYAKYSKKRLTLRKSMMTLSEAESGISGDEKAMIDELVRDGTIETTQAHTLSGIADTDVAPHMQKSRERWDKVMRITGVFFHNAEVANREVTALAAYRLARDSGQNHQAALETARKTVFDSHFDYSGANRPRIMKGNWVKVLTIFKQYSQNMTYLLASNAATMLTLSKTPKADRIAAFKALFGILSGHALMAGTLGLPLMSIIGPALAAALGDEDDEFRDWETMYRNWLADLFGKEAGHAIAKGVINGFTGKDLHSRISLNDIWIRSPNYEMSAREESMHYTMQALGPAVGAGINFFIGLDQMAQGQTLKGFEKMVPKFIRDGIRTYRYSTEGATVGREGYQAMIDEFSVGDVLWQGLGISPARLSEAYGARSSVMNMEKRIKQAKGDLLRDYYRAYRETDYDAMRRIMGEIQQFNQANPMFRIKNLAQSVRTRNRYQQMSESGIYLPYQQKGLLSEARYAL